MSENSKRRWFQFHLATAILVSLAMAGTIYKSCRPRLHESSGLVVRFYGWPYTAFTDEYIDDSKANLETTSWMMYQPHPPEWQIDGLVKDIAIAAASVGIMVIACEVFIRRREAHKT
jgi:hypothetical protein